jgi:hypothetical protein
MPLNLFLPQVTRIPIAGPDPYNTLVCVVAESNGGPQWVEKGKMKRWTITVPTPFILAGFDQRVAPNFQHSSTAFISAVGPVEDSNWAYAVDAVSGAGFDPKDWTYFVNIDVAMSPGEPADGQCTTYDYVDPDHPGYQICDYDMTLQITSFVLCYEPPLPKQGHGRSRIGMEAAARIPEVQPNSLAGALARIRNAPVLLTKAPDDCICKKP